MITIAKFVRNDREDSSNLLVTKTFGKYGVLHRDSVVAMSIKPKPNEWWYCEVVRETGAGTPQGVWVLKPIARVETVERDGFRENNIMHLFLGLYDAQQVGNTLLLHPKRQGHNWICPSALRRFYMLRSKRNGNYQINSVLVVFDHAAQWPQDATGRRAITDPGG